MPDDAPFTITVEITPEDFTEAHSFLASVSLPARMPPEQRRQHIAMNYIMDVLQDAIQKRLAQAQEQAKAQGIASLAENARDALTHRDLPVDGAVVEPKS